MIHEYPFPHKIIDGMLDIQAVRRINREWPQDGWREHHHLHSKKRGCGQREAFGPTTADTIDLFNEKEFAQLFGGDFGMENLVADPSLFGGGLHESFTGGFLSIHADFNLHPDTKFARRLNLLVFLNEGWREEWGGNLELWDAERCAVSIPPIAGRGVLFAATDTSFHGHPDRLACPADVSRRSIALYYYSPLLEGETLRRHSTLYLGDEENWFS